MFCRSFGSDSNLKASFGVIRRRKCVKKRISSLRIHRRTKKVFEVKICFVASSGGHWEELMCLNSICNKADSFFVTEKGGQSNDCGLKHLYLFKKINRKEILFVFHFVWVFIRALVIMVKEKPDVVITTGALLAYPFCLIAKILKKKVIYIESFARVTDASITGKLVYKFADLFIVQWKSMKKVYPKSVYAGSIF